MSKDKFTWKLGDVAIIKRPKTKTATGVESDSGLVRVADFDSTGTPESADLQGVRVVEDAQTNTAAGDYHIIVIEAGRNEQKRRVYTEAALESLPVEPYTHLQMFRDHDEADNGKDIGVRSVDKLASVITKSWVIPGRESDTGHAQVHAIAHVFPGSPFAESMRDPLFRKSVFTSHVADLKGYVGREAGGKGGQDWQVITEIPKRHGVDWVTRPGARGRVVESAKHDETGAEAPTQEENMVDVKTITREALAQLRPDLVTEIETAALANVREEADVTKLKTDLDAANQAAAAATARLRDMEIGSAVREGVAAQGAGIPEAVREQVAQRVAAQVRAMPSDKTAGDALQVAVSETIKTETAYLTAATGKPVVDLTAGKRQPARVSDLQSRVDRLAGIRPPKAD